MDKEQEPEWGLPGEKEHLRMMHIPPRAGEEEGA